MSSPHISFRLNHYQLAKALRILVTLEPNQPIASLSQAAKLIIIDWTVKNAINSSLITSQADIEAIKLICKIPADQINPYTTIQTIMAQAQPKSVQSGKPTWQIERDLEDERLFQEMRRESLAKLAQEKQNQSQLNTKTDTKIATKTEQDIDLDNQIKLAFKASNRTIPKASDFHDPNITESSISTVTDFSPPKDWIK